MKDGLSAPVVFFEPWSLGDVLIAASAARELPDLPAIACHSAWHEVVRAAFVNSRCPALISVDLPYTTRNRANALDPGQQGIERHADVVLSIRGDLRDFAAARKLFRRARIKMGGWIRFLGRKNTLVNAPYALGLLRSENRYESWATLADVPYQQIERTYQRLQADAPRNDCVVIHVGAQWRSKQYPHVAELRDRLREANFEVTLTAGPKDMLPAGVAETEVIRAVDQQLIALLRSAERVITNDSGPMHLAAFLGCRTTAVVRTSPIEEWLPPATSVVRSLQTPLGYRPHRQYMTDNVLPGWPTVEQIVAVLRPDQNVAK